MFCVSAMGIQCTKSEYRFLSADRFCCWSGLLTVGEPKLVNSSLAGVPEDVKGHLRETELRLMKLNWMGNSRRISALVNRDENEEA